MDDLPARIHAATRIPHHTLNQLIARRLPFCLPPFASTPQLYALGLSRFAQIYFAFENAWLRQIGKDDASAQAPEPTGLHGGGVHKALRHIYVPTILRSERLRCDLSQLSIWSSTSLDDKAQTSAVIREVVLDIEDTVGNKPHVLLAHTWIMYMALFNGGRWIREKLIDGGYDYWDGGTDSDNTTPLTHLGLSFWYFDGTQDGEDIKLHFETQVIEAESYLTERERDEVVEEAGKIFEHCEKIVLELDGDASIERRVLSSSSSSSSSSSRKPDLVPSITIISNKAETSRTRATYLRSLLLGVAGLLGGGICAWFWRSNSEVMHRVISQLFGGEEDVSYSYN